LRVSPVAVPDESNTATEKARAGTGEQGNRGTGDRDVQSGKPSRLSRAAQASEALGYFNERLGLHKRAGADKAKSLLARHTLEDINLVTDWLAESRHERVLFLRGSNGSGKTYLTPKTVWAKSNFEEYLDFAREWRKPPPSPAKQTQMTEHTIDGRTCYEYATFPGWASGTHGWYRRESGGWVKATVAELNAAKEERTR
jgi:hypothetical protein